MSLSNTNLRIALPSGSFAVYDVQPHHLNEFGNLSLGERARLFGRQVAHELNGRWFRPDGWTEILDPKLIEIFERKLPEAA